MIIVSERGNAIMQIEADFKKWAKEQGIEDPFYKSRMLAAKHWCKNEDGDHIMKIEFDENGKIIDDPEELSSLTKWEYAKMRNEYVAKRSFNEVDYESFLWKTEANNYGEVSYLRLLDEYVPCNSADGQCRFDCPKFADCVFKAAESPD